VSGHKIKTNEIHKSRKGLKFGYSNFLEPYLTDWLTLWSKVLPEKLTGPQPVKKDSESS
jgi:hypothetical protein